MTAHAYTHKRGGNDPIKLDDLAEPDDNVDLNANTNRHGLLPKLSGDSADALRGDGSWSPPSGGFPNATYLTEADETADLPNSRQLLAGTNVTFDDTVAGERTVNASGSASLSSASAICTSDTNGTTDTFVDVTGASISLVAGTWIIFGTVTLTITSNTYIAVVIADGSNTNVSSGQSGATSSVTTVWTMSVPAVIVTPGSTTTYKLRFATGLNGTNAKATASFASTSPTSIVAVRLA